MNRRSFLHLSSMVASAVALAGCRPAYRALGGPVEILESAADPACPRPSSPHSTG